MPASDQHSTPGRTPGDYRRVDHPHVWCTAFGVDPLAGLLCSWRRTPDGRWEGLVVTTEHYAGSDDPIIRQRWVSADTITRDRPRLVPCATDEHLHRA